MNKAYIFDWDDNVLYMDTKVLMERLVDDKWKHVRLSTSKYAIVRKDPDYRPYKNNFQISFIEFTDLGSRGSNAFLCDVDKAIDKNKFGPSYKDFKECILSGSPFAIVTARGHSKAVIKEAIKHLIHKCFNDDEKETTKQNIIFKSEHSQVSSIILFTNILDRYLETCQYMCVTSPEFISDIQKSDLSIENCKSLALKMVINRMINQCDINSIGFSDDDPNNIQAIQKAIEDDLKLEFPSIDFAIYDTSKKKKKKI